MIVIAHWLERRVAKLLAACLIALLLGPLPVFPQDQPGQEEIGPKPFTPEELEQIVAPIALYSDGLLAQVFMASTYPVEIVQAARFLKANPNLTGDALNTELQKYDWDDSVKFMTTVPPALQMLDEKLDWTQKLGDAFLDQRKETMEAVQRLRAKAQKEGNLKSTPEQTVKVEPAPPPAPPPPPPPGQTVTAPPPAAPTQTIVIEQTNPQTVYVPTYNPAVVYGAWPYPAYPPYAYYPPGYALAGAAISFGIGMAVGGAIWGGCNWGGGDVDIDVNKNNNFNKNVNRGDRQRTTNVGSGNRQSFQHNPEHRKGSQYRNQGTQQRYNKQGPAGAQNRQDFRGHGSGGAQVSDRAGAGAGAGRGEAGRGGGSPSVSDRSSGGGRGGDFGGGGGSPSVSDRSGGGSGGSAFQGMDRGGDARASSQRGQSSLGGSSRGGGGSSSFSGGGGGRSGGGGSFSGGGGGRSGGGGGSRGGGGGRR
jgi:Protein of unknown function (DUF3300)